MDILLITILSYVTLGLSTLCFGVAMTMDAVENAREVKTGFPFGFYAFGSVFFVGFIVCILGIIK